MFRTADVAEPVSDVKVPSEPVADLIALSVIQLDLDAPPSGWAAFLADRGIAIVLDDLGRSAISRDAAKQLFAERRENEVRAREVAERQERQFIMQDQQFRSQLPSGLAWYDVPPGVLPVVAMTQAARDARPRRRSVLQDALSGDGTTFHPIRHDPDEE